MYTCSTAGEHCRARVLEAIQNKHVVDFRDYCFNNPPYFCCTANFNPPANEAPTHHTTNFKLPYTHINKEQTCITTVNMLHQLAITPSVLLGVAVSQ
jgi:tRNA1(Val) A37 N6-methylase TrmN6